MIRSAIVVSVICLVACDSSSSAKPPDGAMTGDTVVVDGPDIDARRGVVCGSELLCENFDALVNGALANNQVIGAFRAEVQGSGTLAIDTTRAYSGVQSLKAHIDGAAQGGGRLFTQSGALFAQTRRHLYGRFMMWNSNDNNSKHWTIFGASGVVPAGNPSSGHTTTYLFSAADDKKFMAVFYDNQTAQDCWHHATELVPVAHPGDHWTCVSFEADADAIHYRMSLDGRAITSFSVTTTGDGCLNAPGTTPWYGPSFDRFYLGALSFHPTTGPIDVWFDDLVVDTQPVECTAADIAN